MPKSGRRCWRGPHRASRSQKGIGAYSTQRLALVLLPKLDVMGSSPIVRSLEVLKLEPVVVAGIPTGPGSFLGTSDVVGGEVIAECIVDGATLLRREHHNLAMLLPGPGKLDLSERAGRRGFVVVRYVVG